jgi:ABC-type nitrate/sulfonate/bicarbonate transport system permease component
VRIRITRSFRRDLGVAVFQICCAAGLIVGFLLAPEPAQTHAARCAAEGTCDGAAAGVDATAVAMPFLLPAFIGLALGAVVGLGLGLWISRAR